MNKCAFIALLCLTCAAAAAQAPERAVTVRPVASGECRVALVIGNGAYDVGPLKNPSNDATDMTAKLSALGFAVESAINANKGLMKDKIRAFAQRAKTCRVALFYYAGHGVQVNGRNYLIPLNATINSEADIEEEAVSADFVLQQLGEAQERSNLIILDACRNNPFPRKDRTSGGGLAAMDAPSGTLIAYATQPGNVSSDGEGRNGLYTGELLKQLGLPSVSLLDVFMRTRKRVLEASNQHQQPWEASSLTANLYLNGKPTDTAAAPPNPDAEMWIEMRDSKNAKDFQAYLQRYPQGQYAGTAQIRLRDLLAASEAAPTEAAATRQYWKPGTPQLVYLAGKSGWVTTGVEVQAGDRVELLTTGQISLGNAGFTGPEGIAGNESAQAVNACPTGALLMKVASHPSQCVRGNFVNVTQTGALQLGLNDNQLRDNSGQFTINLTVYRLTRAR